MSTNLQNLALNLSRPPKRNHRRPSAEYLLRPAKSLASTKFLATLAIISLFFIALSALSFRASALPAAHSDSDAPMPLIFQPFNVSGSPIRYLGRAAHYTLLLSDDEADVVLQQEKAPSQKLQRGGIIVVEAHASLLRMRFVDANPPTSIIPADRERRADAPLTAVAYRGLYPGTDIILRGDQQRMQFQVNLGPGAGASAENIAIQLIGATSITLDPNGNAIIRTGRASLLLQRPIISVGNRAEQLGPSTLGSFRIEDRNLLRFIIDSIALTPHPRTA